MILRRSSHVPAVLIAGLLGLGVAQGAIVYSGVQDINVTTNFEGVYINIASGPAVFPGGDPDAVGNDTFTVGYSEPADWDINIFFGGSGIAFSDTFSPFVDGTASDFRGSVSTASRNARATALNVASAMWWLFTPCNASTCSVIPP